jgi:hypothetical protein
LFIVLNDCIGFSSAPFYITHTSCIELVLTPKCNHLTRLANGLYSIELCAGLLLALQSFSIFFALDNLHKIQYVAAIAIMAKICLSIYIFIIISRTVLYFAIYIFAEKNKLSTSSLDFDYGSFLAPFINNDYWA